jgi:hypothetical protein
MRMLIWFMAVKRPGGSSQADPNPEACLTASTMAHLKEEYQRGSHVASTAGICLFGAW